MVGQGPGVLGAFLSVALFDFLFVEPRLSFAVHDGQYLITFVVMLLVALLISQLSSQLQQQVLKAQQREQWYRILYECARFFAGAMTIGQVDEILKGCLSNNVTAQRVAMYLPDELEHLACSDANKPSECLLPEQLQI